MSDAERSVINMENGSPVEAQEEVHDADGDKIRVRENEEQLRDISLNGNNPNARPRRADVDESMPDELEMEDVSLDDADTADHHDTSATNRMIHTSNRNNVGHDERTEESHNEQSDGGPQNPTITSDETTQASHEHAEEDGQAAQRADTSTPSTPPVNSRSTARPPPIRIESHKDSNGTNGPVTGTPRSAAFRPRSDSQSTTATNTTQGSTTRTSLVFVISALETLAASKDAQRRKDFRDATQSALEEIKTKGDPNTIDPGILFLPLKLATSAQTESVVTTALDCIGKLISYSYFSMPSESPSSESGSLIDQAIDTICDCFEGESTPDRVQLQIIISLLAAVLNDKVVVHGAGLLKAVRQMYNIFLHSKNTRNQQVAQGTLAQMVATVFERAKARVAAKEARLNLAKSARGIQGGVYEQEDSLSGLASPAPENSTDPMGGVATPDEGIDLPSDRPVEKEAGAKMTLQTFERRGSFDEDHLKEGPTMVTRVKDTDGTSKRRDNGEGSTRQQTDVNEEDVEDEVYMKDAFLVFRAMCKISIKSLRPEEIIDLRSQGMRTKLLSLHIIHTVLFNNMSLFLSPLATIRSGSNSEPTPFTQAIKQLLCQSLSRNGASSVNRVFDVSAEIFYLMIKHLRVMLKKEVEVFLKEIYLNILENRTAPAFQKQCLLAVLERLVEDPRALVEIYLNYDCDRTASDNMFQRIVEHLSRICTTPVTITSLQQHAYQTQQSKKITLADWQLRGTVPPSLATASISAANEQPYDFPVEYAMKQQALEGVVQTLRSLVHWAQGGVLATANMSGDVDLKLSSDDVRRDSSDVRTSGALASPYLAGTGTETPPIGSSMAEDDPEELEKARQRKMVTLEAVRQFNFKPKRGIKMLIERGFIRDNMPESIARFLLTNDKLSKAAIGEYLGEGDAENIAIMHAFVDSMDFTKTRFVDALRRFLQSFRLPGEAQKIDRFMLKFAERYIVGNPNAFANADTAYVLAYSVIMLNTDQHSVKMKGARMTPEAFIKNNRGINDNADLPDEYLRAIFDEIAHNEIVLYTEREAAANLGIAQTPAAGFATSLGQAFATVGRDLQREAYAQKSEEMANKTEQLFKTLLRAQRKSSTKQNISKFIPAVSYKHAGPMFDVTWMSFLTALSGCAQDTNNLETVRLCMEGLKLAIQLACFFDLSNPRQAFVQSIARFTNLYNLSEMKAKNVEALRVLLDVAHTEGNLLNESWRDILTCISQLDRFQLISEGVPEHSIPDVAKAQPPLLRSSTGRSVSRKSLAVPSRTRLNSVAPTNYRSEVAEESRSSGIIHGVDRIFSGTSKLNGEAIVHFVRALTQVSWQEIESSGDSSEPRTYSLQKLVEVSEYNMNRVRFEWTNIWQVLGDHFNQVGCHTNTRVVHFALNSLRQLSVRFLDIEELPGFKFQKDFLKPFEHIMNNTSVVQVKEIVLHSVIQMIQARGEKIHSGWRTIFGVFTIAARERLENIVTLAYDNVIQIYNTRFGVVIAQGAFPDLAVCLTDFSKNARFQKKSLQAIETLKSTIPKMLKTPECPLSADGNALAKQVSRQTQEEQFWFPVLFAFHDVLMTGDDLEVRSRALNFLFDTLIKYGKDFPREFWDTIWRQLLYPIFMVMKSKPEMSKMVNHEELSVWLSTTMIQALRNMMTLFTHYFDSLEYMLDRFLDLLALCICQENDTLARIGSNCLQTLILQNVNKFTMEHWGKIVSSFVDLFNRTEATALFSAVTAPHPQSAGMNGSARPQGLRIDSVGGAELPLSEGSPGKGASRRPDVSRTTSEMSNGDASPKTTRSLSRRESEAFSPTQSGPSTPTLEDYRPDGQLQQTPIVVTAARRRFFNQIITKCVLQLLLIETVNELFSNDDVYERIPSMELLRLMALLKKSYHFAKRFNGDLDLRNRLFQEGFMKQPPNLLKQESGSASVYVNILFRMYQDEGEERRSTRDQTEAALIPLCVDIIEGYLQLREETQQRNIVTWRPVVIEVIEGYSGFHKESFEKHASVFAPLATALMGREMGLELQRALQSLIHRIFEVHYDMPILELPPPTPMSPRPSVFGSKPASRRQSRIERK